MRNVKDDGRGKAAKRLRWSTVGAAAFVLTIGAAAAAKDYSGWGPPEPVADVNSASSDGCPIMSPDGQYLYFASNRGGGQGGLDIWRAPKSGDGWGTPENLGAPINTSADEFCPDPARGNRLFFVRRLSATNTDIFLTRSRPQGWTEPEPLPRGDDAINSPAEEWSPSYFETADGREMLYFSSTRVGPAPRQDIFYSVNFGPAQMASGGVHSSASDARPNVRHDGLEIVWDSTRTGSLGGPDIWTASRSSLDEPWGTAVQLGNGINSAGNETRASLSWDGTKLFFGSTRGTSQDIFMSTRDKVTGQDR